MYREGRDAKDWRTEFRKQRLPLFTRPLAGRGGRRVQSDSRDGIGGGGEVEEEEDVDEEDEVLEEVRHKME